MIEFGYSNSTERGNGMPPRALRTPLTLAVLSLLRESPRHPYETQALVRERHVDEVVKLRGGSLYDAIRRLTAAGLIAAVETERAGARPERTVYAITDSGATLVDDLVRGYLRTPAREHPVFVTGLAYILNVDAATAAGLLRERLRAIQATYDEIAGQLAAQAPGQPAHRGVGGRVRPGVARRRTRLAARGRRADRRGHVAVAGPAIDQASPTARGRMPRPAHSRRGFR